MTRTLADALAWLRARVPADACLYADSRAIGAGDVFLAYAVDGADSRPYIGAARARGAAAVLVQPEGWAANPGLGAADGVLAVPRLGQLAGLLASAWYGAPSAALNVTGFTGTNGKTSCSHWLAAALTGLGTPCGVIGTLGCGLPGALVPNGFTTPDAPRLQCLLAQLRRAGARAVSMEVSSHALQQGRVNGIDFDLAVFTNLTQDHLDYHGTLTRYDSAKARLFDWPGLRHAVINHDDAAGRRLITRLRGVTPVIGYGLAPPASETRGTRLVLAEAIRPTARGTALTVRSDWGHADVEVATLGAFNVSNLLAVLGALLAQDVAFDAALAQLAQLAPVPGRMQRLGGRLRCDEPLIVIDYAHTPDALEKTLAALRPVAQERGGALLCVFGCGGDRDASKRPLMGRIAETGADAVVLTSDNPRGEPPLAIIEQIAVGMRSPNAARRIEDRASAILQTIRGAAREDVVVVAGKGHEATQEIMGRKRQFSDQDHAALALAARSGHARGAAL